MMCIVIFHSKVQSKFVNFLSQHSDSQYGNFYFNQFYSSAVSCIQHIDSLE